MKAIATAQPELTRSRDQLFCLRQRDSELFWDGQRWAHGLSSARGYLDLECALAIASKFSQQPIDLLVVFPTRQRSVAIPLGREAK